LNTQHGKARDRSNPDESTAAGKTGAKWKTIVLSVAVIVIVGVVAGIAIYRDRVAPFNTVIIEVNDTRIEMRYFLKRVAMSGEPAIEMLHTLVREQMIKLAAVNPPFNIEAAEENIDRFARELSAGESESIGEGEFREWYRQQLNETRLSDAEYRDLLKTAYLSMKMAEHLIQFVPTEAEQVFVNMILVENYAEGIEVKEKYEAGGDFSALALEYSVDPAVGEAGGKIGWFPPGVLEPTLDDVAFDLDVAGISDPIYLDQHRIVVMMISDKAGAREIDDRSLAILKSKVLDHWYAEAHSEFEVQIHGFDNGYDSETDAWVQWQLKRMQRRHGGT
jgi:hypothetical protein